MLIEIPSVWVEETDQLTNCWCSSTWNVPMVTVRLASTSLPLELVEVWVVDDTGFDDTRPPVEGRVTVRAPHLTTPRYLEDHGTTRGTRFGILCQQLGSLHVVGITFVVIAGIGFVTFRTDLHVTEFALPVGSEEPLTIQSGTLTNERLLLGSRFKTVTIL